MLDFSWSVIFENLGFLLQGLRFTFGISVLSMSIGLALGLLIAFARLSRIRILSRAAYVYTELFRSLPILVLLFWFHWAVPVITGVTFAAFTSVVVAFALNIGAFQAEAYRAGILSIPRAQRDAAIALGMTEGQAMTRVILPQAVPRIIPVTGSIWVSLFKDTSLAAIIAVPELMYQGRVIALTLFRPLEMLSTVALLYFVIVYPQARLVERLYRRLLPDEDSG